MVMGVCAASEVNNWTVFDSLDLTSQQQQEKGLLGRTDRGPTTNQPTVNGPTFYTSRNEKIVDGRHFVHKIVHKNVIPSSISQHRTI